MRVTVEDKQSKVVIVPDDMAKQEWDGAGIAGRLIKAEPERRYTLTMAYPAYKADKGVALDGHQDFANAEEVEKAAWNYMTNPSVGLWHEDGTDGAGRVVESYIYRGPDWAIKAANDTEVIVKAGDWLLGVQWAEETWPRVLDGEIGGVSMQGTAKRRTPSPDSLERLRD